jgi:hypothetical protein
MKKLKENKKLIILISAILLLIVLNTVINSFAVSAIEEKISDFKQELVDEGAPNDFIMYDDMSYSFLSSTVSFDNVRINMDDDEYLTLDEISINIDPDELPSFDELNDGKFNLNLSGSELSLISLEIVDRRGKYKIGKLELSFDGKIVRDNAFFIEKMYLNLKGLDVLSRDFDMTIEEMGFELDFDQNINLLEMENMSKKEIIGIDGQLTCYMKDFFFPKKLTREMELLDKPLDGVLAEFKVNKDNDDVNFEFVLKTKSLGDLDIESEIDLSVDIDDSMIELDIELDNLDSELYRLFRRSKLEKVGDDGFKLEYNGPVSGLKKIF